MTDRAFKLTLILLTLIGLMVFWQGRAWAGIYVAYDSNPMMVLDGTTLNSSGVTEALRNNVGARILFESTGGTAESTIKAYSAGSSGVSECLSGVSNCGSTASYETFTVSGVSVTPAIETGVLGRCESNLIASVGVGKLYKFTRTFALNSGTTPLAVMGYDAGGVFTAPAGEKSITLSTGTDYLTVYLSTSNRLGIYNASAANWNMTDTSLQLITSPGSNGVYLGPVQAQGGFDPNKITKFKIMQPVSPREQRRHRTGPWRVVWDSAVN
jgi:hypothetical protein